MTAKEEEAVLLTLILEVQVMNPSDPQFQGKTAPPSGLPVSPAHLGDQCGDDLYRYALSRIGQSEVAEDVVQDTLLAAIKGLGRFDRRSSEKTWLLSIPKRKIADHFREHFRKEKFFEDEFRREDLAEQFDENGWRVRAAHKKTRQLVLYTLENFRRVVEVSLTAPIYWAMELVAAVAKDRISCDLKCWQPEEGLQGAVVFVGSVSSAGNVGQISYSSTKAGFEGAAATLMAEAIHYGVRRSVIHPGFTDTPTVRAIGEEYFRTKVISTDSTETADQARRNSRSHLLYDNERRCER
jgi:RNA polymerase sigma factor (sigma-70 family)